MAKSMTGYGNAEAEVSTKRITVEIRTLNSKQLDLSVKLPPLYRQQEYDLRALAAKSIGRGKADIHVTVENRNPTPAVTINPNLFKDYYHQIENAVKNAGMGTTSNDDKTAALVPAILRLPDVLVSEVSEVSEAESVALVRAFEEALENLDKFRRQEGEILIDDMLARVEKIGTLTTEIAPFEEARTETVRQRILDNIAKLGIEPDRNRLEQEMVFYIERLDITEEKVRLGNHCLYFRQTAKEEESVGRKLGFIAQEMGREINTLGSKANDADIQKRVVQMKDELEKMKEQLLNLL